MRAGEKATAANWVAWCLFGGGVLAFHMTANTTVSLTGGAVALGAGAWKWQRINWENVTSAHMLAFVLVVLLLVAEHGNWQHSSDLRRVCELLGGEHMSWGSLEYLTPQQEIDTICSHYEGDDYGPDD